MTEKEKMLMGNICNYRDSELLEMYFNTRQLLQHYNITIGAGSAVTKDIPDNVLAFGMHVR